MDVSVVIVTHNPFREILSWALDSLQTQSFSPDRFEVIIVDNNSRRPVGDLDILKNRPFSLRVVVEPQPGTGIARCRGIKESRADLILFLDDDNYIDPDYLERATSIAAHNPSLGCFGGVSRLLTDIPQPAWKEPLFLYIAVRDFGREIITSNENRWGKWEPIGAGMFFRRQIGLAYAAVVETNPLAAKLGRSPTSNICGEDSLLARTGYRFGYSCSYQPDLKLTHFIRSQRLTSKALFRTIEGIGRSHVLLETVLGTSTFAATGLIFLWVNMLRNAWHRVKVRGFKVGLIEAAWDVGYMRQVRECRKYPKEISKACASP